MPDIHIYKSETAPPNRRFIAQYETQKMNMFVTIQGASAEEAEAKARLMLEYADLDPKAKSAFDLKRKLAELCGAPDAVIQSPAEAVEANDDFEDLL